MGGPHIGPPYVWPMALIVQALTSDDDAEIEGLLKVCVVGCGLMRAIVRNKHRRGRFVRAHGRAFLVGNAHEVLKLTSTNNPPPSSSTPKQNQNTRRSWRAAPAPASSTRASMPMMSRTLQEGGSPGLMVRFGSLSCCECRVDAVRCLCCWLFCCVGRVGIR